MKHVKRILVSLFWGFFMGVMMGLVYRFLTGQENWLKDALIAGWFYAIGIWFGIGIEFFHKDDNK